MDARLPHFELPLRKMAGFFKLKVLIAHFGCQTLNSE
jgi:hypothetical protein